MLRRKHPVITAVWRNLSRKQGVLVTCISFCRVASSRAYRYRGRFRTIGSISNRETATEFVTRLSPSQRNFLEEALKKQQLSKEVGVESDKTNGSVPTASQLRRAAFQSAVPFIGFGFLDNAIMIVAGEYIDFTIGAALGISTMAAAALGNLVSDVSGMGLAHYVEAAAEKMGFQGPGLSSKQLELPRTRLAINLGRSIGLSLGCIVGMFPLLLYTFGGSKDSTESKEDSS